MRSQAEESLPPNRQQLNNRENARNLRQNVSRLSAKFLKQTPLQIRRLPSAAISLQKGGLISTFITVVSDGSFNKSLHNVLSIGCAIIITAVHFLD